MRSLAILIAVATLGGCATTPPGAHVPAAPQYHAAFGASSCAAGAQGIAPAATLTFTPPTQNTDGTPVNAPLTFNLYQGTSSGTETKVQSGITASPEVVNSGLKGGATYYFELTAVDANGVESARSNEACKAMAASVPNSFVITIQ